MFRNDEPRNLSRLLLLILVCLWCPANAMAQMRLSSEEADKLLLKSVEAKYPKIVVPYPPKGVVIIETTVWETGVVTSTKAIEGHPYLHDAAVSAVKKYKYKPHTGNCFSST